MPWPKETKATRRSGSGWEWDRTRKRVLQRDGGRCHWCSGLATTADHLLAKAFGGSDELSNLVASCQPCNMRRAHEQSKEGQRRKVSRLRAPEPHPGRGGGQNSGASRPREVGSPGTELEFAL